MDSRLSPILDLADAIETGGLGGFIAALPRMIGPNQPDASCISETDACMDDAVGNEEYWDCALGMAECLRGFELDPIIELPPPPEEPTPDPPRPDPKPPDLATIALATLIFQMRRKSTAHGSRNNSSGR